MMGRNFCFKGYFWYFLIFSYEQMFNKKVVRDLKNQQFQPLLTLQTKSLYLCSRKLLFKQEADENVWWISLWRGKTLSVYNLGLFEYLSADVLNWLLNLFPRLQIALRNPLIDDALQAVLSHLSAGTRWSPVRTAGGKGTVFSSKDGLDSLRVCV